MLSEFHRLAWPNFDPAAYVANWHLDAIAEHLEAVTFGGIKRLLITIPPRCSKSSLVAVSWPAWTWLQSAQQNDSAPAGGKQESCVYPLAGPKVRFLFASYSQDLSERDSRLTRQLVGSDWYRRLWPKIAIRDDLDTVRKFELKEGGYRVATSVGGTVTGIGGSVLVVDDALNAKQADYTVMRTAANQWWDESLSTRLDDAVNGAKVVIMQRLHEDDLVGHILEKDEGEWVSLVLPMRHDPRLHCVTYLDGDDEPFWEDPRTEDGELLCPDRFPEEAVRQLETDLGPFAASCQLQQSPIIRGGSLIKAEWWNLWDSEAFPEFGLTVASLDTAIKDKERNDYSALTIWGTFMTPDERKPAVMLRHAWRGRCDLATLVASVAKDCTRFGVDVLLIEDKTRGTDVQNEIWRLYGKRKWQTVLVPVKGDKVSRTIAVQHLWSGDMRIDPTTGLETFVGGVIWAPDREWAQMVIDEMGSFPLGSHDDLHDSATQAIGYLREYGITLRREEYDDEVTEAMTYRRQTSNPYDL